ncbi:hypothetical protein CBR_g25934 [Chara braunii]|uniref:Reverse transcriptase domain-containing protein n=1 Tax=Chara braunii TaxID=69332 RepID=A0A388L6Q6_CHABU|nr:hypothetical protein CBR_g25934 [Chara braunii]|eukprot:GBG78001.1 hypothetical protein CBR_g25934 [Chara braunii]
MLNYDGGDEVKMKINVEGAKEVEMRTDGKLQDAITEAKDCAERRCRRDGVTARLQVTVSYHETETSMDTADLEQAHVDRDSGGESEMGEAGDRETDLRSWNRPGEIQRHHRAVRPVEEGPEISAPRLDSEKDDGMKKDRSYLMRWREAWARDIFRDRNPGDPGFTWFGNPVTAPNTKRRLDYFLLSEEASKLTIKVETQSASLSDHKPVVMDISLGQKIERGSGLFRLNVQNLEDDGWKQWFAVFWSSWRESQSEFESIAKWVDKGLRIIARKFDVFSRIAANQRNSEERRRKQRVEEAERNMTGHPVSEVVWGMERANRLRQWEELQLSKEKRWRQILAVKGIVSSDRITKDSFKRLLPQRKQMVMSELAHPLLPSMPRATSLDDMCEYAMIYFQDILTTSRQGESIDTDMSTFANLWDNLQAKLPDHMRQQLDRPLSEEELRHTIKAIARGKALGDDGLPIEFYEACWGTLEADLLNMYNEILVGGKLGSTMTRGIITLMFKKGDKSLVKNWRPISLLNVSYKILAKSLATRLGAALPLLVGKDQGAFVKGRSIFENIVTAIEVLEVVSEEDMEMTVLLLDLEKAYNRVNWAFVMTSLKEMGFGVCFCRWVKVLYTYSTAAVMVNGKCSAEFPLSRSLRQGCPILLFVLQMEVLVNSIRTNMVIKGMKLSEEKECKIKALADDLMAVCTSKGNSLSALKNCLTIYAEFSEAAVNWEKSVYLLPDTQQIQRKDVWIAIMSDVFIGKWINSKFWKEILQAWQTVKPSIRAAPTSKQQVLEQHIFDNPHITDSAGSSITARRGTSNFGYKWIQRGVTTIKDLRNEETNQWHDPTVLKEKLGQLPAQEERVEQIKESLPAEWKALLGPKGVNPPAEWKALLGPEGVNPPGTWLRSEDGTERYYRLKNWHDTVEGKCVLEVYEKESLEALSLVSFGTIERYGLSGLTECRVREGRPKRLTGKGARQLPVVVGGGRRYSTLRIDPESWGWEKEGEVVIGLDHIASTACIQPARRKVLMEKLTDRWKKAILNLDPPKETELQSLWKQFKEIPSQKLASLLWMQSHIVVPTAMWLRNRGMVDIDPKCGRCGWLYEDVKHL